MTLWPKRRLFRWLLVTAVLLAAPFAVDRIALSLWDRRVKAFYERVRQDAPAFYADGKRAIGFRPRSDSDLDPRMTVSFQDTAIRPDGVTVDPEKGVLLIFVPPALAWTTRLYPRYSVGHGISSEPLANHRYIVTISRPTPDRHVTVTISKGFMEP